MGTILHIAHAVTGRCEEMFVCFIVEGLKLLITVALHIMPLLTHVNIPQNAKQQVSHWGV